jgi:hypothetical protein
MARLDPIVAHKVNRRVANHHTINGSDVSPALHSITLTLTFFALQTSQAMATFCLLVGGGPGWRSGGGGGWLIPGDGPSIAGGRHATASGLKPQTSIWLDPAMFGQWMKAVWGIYQVGIDMSACQTMQRCKYQVRMFEYVVVVLGAVLGRVSFASPVSRTLRPRKARTRLLPAESRCHAVGIVLIQAVDTRTVSFPVRRCRREQRSRCFLGVQ